MTEAPQTPAPWRNRLRSVLSAALGLGALGAAASLLAVPEATGADDELRSEAEVAARTVTVTHAANTEHVRELRFAGVVRAQRRAALGFVLPGRVAERLVELGDHVEPGQALARLDRRQLKRAVEMADAAAARAEADVDHGRLELGRLEALSAANAVATADVEDADHANSVAAAVRRQASAQARAARRDLAEGVVVAPFSGRVARVVVEAGELVAAGQPVLEIVGDDALELEVQLPESMLADLGEGQSLPVELPMLDRTVMGEVRTIGAAAPQSAGLFPVVVSLPEGLDLRAGMTARIVVTSSVGSGLSVPVEAVVDRTGESPTVMTVSEGRVAVQAVEVVAIAGASAVVRGEIPVGAVVITRGHAGLTNGDEVNVRP